MCKSVVSDTSVTFQLNFFVLTDLRQCLDDGAKFNELVFLRSIHHVLSLRIRHRRC